MSLPMVFIQRGCNPPWILLSWLYQGLYFLLVLGAIDHTFSAIDHTFRRNHPRKWKNLDCFENPMWAMFMFEVTFFRAYFSKYNGISYLAKKCFYLCENRRFLSILSPSKGTKDWSPYAWKSNKTRGRVNVPTELPIQMQGTAYIIASVAQQWIRNLSVWVSGSRLSLEIDRTDLLALFPGLLDQNRYPIHAYWLRKRWLFVYNSDKFRSASFHRHCYTMIPRFPYSPRFR